MQSRLSNLELLRIVAMLMIIAHHFFYRGILVKVENDFVFGLTALLFPGGSVGNGIFFMLTGYFLINSVSSKKNKIIKLLGQALFWAVFALGVHIVAKIVFKLDIESGIRATALGCVLPISYGNWWFITVYVLILVLSDKINLFLERLSSQEHLLLIAVMFAFWYFLPTVLGVHDMLSGLEFGLNWYVIGAYFRKYGLGKMDIGKCWLVLIFVLSWIVQSVPFFYVQIIPQMLINAIAVPCMALSVLTMFIISLKVGEFRNETVNSVSASVFGVYLFHESIIMREVLWNYVFNPMDYWGTRYIFVQALIAVVVIFVVGVLVDLVRRLYVAKALEKFYADAYAKLLSVGK